MLDQLQQAVEKMTNEIEGLSLDEQLSLIARLKAVVDDIQWVTMTTIHDLPCVIRPFDIASDSVTELTTLLHDSYRRMAEMGINFVASWQDETRTLRRISKGRCLVAMYEGKYIGTVTFYNPGQTKGSPWYNRHDVGQFQMLAVNPEFQKIGLGSFLLDFIEQMATKLGLNELACDTSEKADELIEFYRRRGYRFIENIQWPEVNYRSVLLSKQLRNA